MLDLHTHSQNSKLSTTRVLGPVLDSTVLDFVLMLEKSSSGKAGGFLARDWGSGPTRALHEVGFRSISASG